MVASELIKQLQNLVEKHGDIPVFGRSCRGVFHKIDDIKTDDVNYICEVENYAKPQTIIVID